MKLKSLAQAFSVVTSLIALQLTAVAMDVYVVPDGDDAAAGTLQAPLETIQGARDKIRKSRIDTTSADGAAAMTLSAWINPDVEAGYIGILSTSGDYFALNISGTGSGNKADFRAGNRLLYSPDNMVPINQWTHLVGVWERGSSHKLYINGVLAATNGSPSSDPIDPDMWYLASDRLISGRYFNGQTKGVHVWSRALSVSEITAMAANDSLIPSTPLWSQQALTDFNGSRYELLNTVPLPAGGIDVHFREGRYPFTASTTMDAGDSGDAGSPITYKAYADEEVVFDGSTALNSADFSLVTDPTELARLGSGASGNVYRCSITNSSLQTQLSSVNAVLDLDGKMAQVSRYPNVGNCHIDTVLDEGAIYAHGRTPGDPPTYDMDNPIGAEFTLQEQDASRWETEFQSVQKAQVTGYLNNDWYKQTHRIADITSGVITLLEYSRYGVSSSGARRLYVLNLLCELDSPGEWWFDETANVLYVWPYEPITAESNVGVWNSPDFLKLYCSHVTFENLIIQGTSQGGSGSGMVTFYAGDSTKFSGCTFRNTSRPAVAIINGGTATNCGIIGCDLYDAASHLGLYGGVANENEITPAGNYAINCHFTQVNSRDYLGRCYVRGVGNIFKNNLIHNLPDDPVKNGGYGNVVEKNEVFNCGFESGDGGAMYWSAGFESYGNVFRHNFLHHLMCTPGLHAKGGMYADQRDAGDSYEENVFYKAAHRGILLNGGAGQSALRNVFLNGYIGIYQMEVGAQDAYDAIPLYDDGTLTRGDVGDYIWRAEQVVGTAGWNSEPWLSHFPTFALVMNQEQMRFWPIENYFYGNLFCDNESSNFQYNYGGGNTTTDINSTPSYIHKGDNRDITMDIFENPEKLDFAFIEPCPAYAPDIPFDDIGLYIGDGRRAMPDKDTYRSRVKRHFEGRSSYDGSASYDPATINGLIYWNTGKLLYNIQNDSERLSTADLISYWPCDETTGITAADQIGDNDAVGVNFSGTEWVPGSIGQTVDLDGNAPMADRPNYSGSNQKMTAQHVGDGATALSISLWVNPDIDHDGRTVGDGSANSGARGYVGLITTAQGSPQYWGINFIYQHLTGDDFNTTGIDFRGHNGGLPVYGDTVTAEGGWYHVVGVWDGANKILYINGREVARQVATGDPINVSTWQFGQDRDIVERYFDGQLDDVALFNAALTADDVNLIYEKGQEGSALQQLLPFADTSFSDISVGPTDAVLSWDSSGAANFYTIYSVTDLPTASEPWPILAYRVPPAGDTTSFVHTGVLTNDFKRFYRISSEE